MKTGLKKWLTPTGVTVAVCLLYVLGVLISAGGDPMTFALLGTRFSQGDPHGTEGYDGQFVYQIALDPLGAAPYIDVPAYRYQRILYPLLARLLALGQPALIPWMLILVNLAAIGGGTWATGQLLADLRVSRWYALVYGLYGSQLLSLRADLNEPLAQAMIQLAMLAWIKNRPGWTAVAFGLAALGKETTLLFLAAFLLYHWVKGQWRWIFILGTAALPFLAYQGLLWLWLGEFGIGSGGAGATAFSLIPLGGWLALANVKLTAFLVISLVVVPLSILPALAGVGLSLRSLRQWGYHPYIYCLLLNAVVILFLPTSTFREPVAMLRLTQGLVVSMLLYGALVRSWRVLNYSTFWLAANVLLLKGVA